MIFARNNENVLNFVKVRPMPKILLVPFFRTRCSLHPYYYEAKNVTAWPKIR